MPKASKYTKDEVYKSIMGSNTPKETERETEETQSTTETNAIVEQLKNNANDLDELVHKSYYITKRHVKALKFRTAMSDKPEEKDFSAIVRAALDIYLADTLRDL